MTIEMVRSLAWAVAGESPRDYVDKSAYWPTKRELCIGALTSRPFNALLGMTRGLTIALIYLPFKVDQNVPSSGQPNCNTTSYAPGSTMWNNTAGVVAGTLSLAVFIQTLHLYALSKPFPKLYPVSRPALELWDGLFEDDDGNQGCIYLCKTYEVACALGKECDVPEAQMPTQHVWQVKKTEELQRLSNIGILIHEMVDNRNDLSEDIGSGEEDSAENLDALPEVRVAGRGKIPSRMLSMGDNLLATGAILATAPTEIK